MTTIDETGQNTGTVTQLDQQAGGLVAELQQTVDDKIIERLRTKGQDYLENEKDWKFFLRAYEGGREYISEETLFRHPREVAGDYDRRALRAHYQNYCQPLVDFVPEYIFSQDVEREAPKDLNDEYQEFKKNCDRSGSALNDFMQLVGEEIRIFGMVFVQVDKPENDDKDLSVFEAKQRGLHSPYLVLIRPLEVLDHRLDPQGNLMYLKRVENIWEEDGEDGWRQVERYTEWRTKSFEISRIDVTDKDKPKLIDQVKKGNPWGIIPIVLSFFKRKKSNHSVGQSFLQDISYQNRSVFNNTSLIDEFLYRQCFNILVVPTRGAAPMKNQVEGLIGTGNVWEVSEDSKVMPQYLSPPATSAQFIQSERDNSVREMYRQAAQDMMSELLAAGKQSGDAQKVSFSRTIPVINKTADSLQHTETRLMTIWARMLGKDWNGKISYKDDYSITNLMDLLLNLSMIFNDLKLWSPTFIKEEWKRLVREFDGKLEPEIEKKILAEIESMPEEELKTRFAAPAPDRKASEGAPSTGDRMQGKQQARLGSDNRISAASGSRASTKEASPDSNKRSTSPSNRR